MKNCIKIILAILFVGVQCKPYDDGKYKPNKYRYDDDGKYYRPLTEGKYVPSNEGKYTYVYVNTLYPAFPYIHKTGPDGDFGGDGYGIDYELSGSSRHNGPSIAYGPPDYQSHGPNGPDGPGGPNGPNAFDESNRIQYIGRRIYAERFPYLYKEIKALIKKYVSTDGLFSEVPEGSINHYNIKANAGNETVVKCEYFMPKQESKAEKQVVSPDDNHDIKKEYTLEEQQNGENKDVSSDSDHNEDPDDNIESVTLSPLELDDSGKSGKYYSFKGTKVIGNNTNISKRKLKLEYVVVVKLVEDFE